MTGILITGMSGAGKTTVLEEIARRAVGTDYDGWTRADDHVEAFTAYERRIRGFVEQNQALVTVGRSSLAPDTQELIDARNTALRAESVTAETSSEAHIALALPEYSAA